MLRRIAIVAISLTVALATMLSTTSAAPPSEPLATLCEAGPEGAGSTAAQTAWRSLARTAGRSDLPAILAAMDGANPIASNYLAMAADVVASRGDAPLPMAQLRAFLQDTRHEGRARQLALEYLLRFHPEMRDQLVEGLFDDPFPGLRRQAAAHWRDRAEALREAGQLDDAEKAYRRALAASTDPDTARVIARLLREQCDAEVDLAAHFGLIRRWYVVGPFDNEDERGFLAAQGPETRAFDPSDTFQGKHGQVRWQRVDVGTDGLVDLNEHVAHEKSVTAYLATPFRVDAERDVELRFWTLNAVAAWVNGEPLAQFDVYHSGEGWDQYVCPARLKAGRNVIMLKVAQNAQTQDWADGWHVTARVCDPTGRAVLSKDRPE